MYGCVVPAHNFGFEAVARLPMTSANITAGNLLEAIAHATELDPASRVLVHALRAERMPTHEEMYASLRQTLLYYYINVSVAPATPGYDILRAAISREVRRFVRGGGEMRLVVVCHW